MHIKQIPIRNDLRNFMYLLACEKTSAAIAIDPLDHALSVLRQLRNGLENRNSC